MSATDIVSTLERLRERVEGDDFSGVDETLETLVSEYDTRESVESIQREQAAIVRRDEDLSAAEREAIDEYGGTLAQTEFLRASILAATGFFLINPEETNGSELSDGISQLIAAEETLAARSEEADVAVGDIEVPARIDIASVDGLADGLLESSTGTVELTIANTGDESATSITVTPDSELSVSPDERTISRIAPGGRERVTFDVGGPEPGDYELVVTASSDDAGTDSREVPIPIRSIATVYRQAAETLRDLVGRVETSDSIDGSTAAELVEHLEEAIENIERASERLDAGEKAAADDEIRSAISAIERFVSELESASGLSASRRWTVSRGAEVTVEQLRKTLDSDAGDGDEVDARIVDVSVDSGTFETGEDVGADVTLKNTGTQERTFFAGYSAIGPDGTAYTNDGTTGGPVTLAAGETATVTLEWTVEDDAPDGSYTAHVAVWAESDRDALETKLDEVLVDGAFAVGASGGGVDGRIVDTSVDSGTFRRGDAVTASVTVENTGGSKHRFFVGYSAIGPDGAAYTNDDTTGRPVTLATGETTTVTVGWTVEDDAPSGSYTAHLAVWAESDRDALETKLDEVLVDGAFRVG